MNRKEIALLVDSVIDEFNRFDLDPNKICDDYSEDPVYLRRHRHTYIRTICDVVEFSERRNVDEILEIGAFFGLVSICLAKLGFRVCAADVPEYMSMQEQKDRFDGHGIEVAEVRLEDYILPFEDERFDAIIMCEVLEHLNFNPLPLIKEINRIGSQGSLFYLSLPNIAKARHRLKMLRGRSIHPPIQTFFNQLDPGKLDIANAHWREYTAQEIREMLGRMGYEIDRQYFFGITETIESPSLRKRLGRQFYRWFPSLKENQTTLAIKAKRTDVVFRIPGTVHRTLESL